MVGSVCSGVRWRAAVAAIALLVVGFTLRAGAQTGACCTFGGSCSVTSMSSCTTGFFHASQACQAACPMRACCRFLSGSCRVTWNCNDGIPQSALTCSPSPCSQPTTGACCSGTGCTITTSLGCIGGSGVWNPSQTCAQVACGQLGACCDLFTGACTSVTQSGCPSSRQFNAGGTCTPNPCATGACCHPDGTCALTSSFVACSSLTNFVFGGFGSTCTAFPCPASGACCQFNQCTQRFATECTAAGAVFTQGAACGPVLCPPEGACCRHSECLVTLQADCIGNHTWAGAGTACGPRNDCCPADFNLSQALSVQDIFDFLAAYFAGDPAGDFNGVGGATVQDIFDFLAAYFAGC